MTGAPALRVDGVTRIFASGAGIRDVGFTARDNAVTAVIGPNGAGKTVLFSVIAGLMPADSGRIETAPQARIAYCPDVPQFEAWLTAREIVEMSQGIAGARGGIPPVEALTICGLATVMDRRVAAFSRGMLQRLGIAAALVLDPDVLILDEPNSALDPIGRAEVRELIHAQRKERCVLLSSHLLSEVEQLADDIVVMNDGSVVMTGTTESVLAHAWEPVWNIRLASPPHPSWASLARHFPGARFEPRTATLCTVEFPDIAQAATDLRRLIAAIDAPLLEVCPSSGDLDASFSRIVQREEH